MPAPRLFKLNRPLAPNASSDPGDVHAVKLLFAGLGIYQTPDWGLSAYPDRALFDAIRAFQRERALKADGVMKPGGDTEDALRALHAHGEALRAKGRFGDTLLAHISPAEARLLEAHGGAGTINPETGLLEFYDSGEKHGQYIWRTRGDGKVRSAHADRHGKTFSWNDPPDGGHPGEAPNCRCWAEPVAAEDKRDDEKCGNLRRLMEESWDRHDALFKPIEDAKYRRHVSKKILDDLKARRSEILSEMQSTAMPDRIAGRSPIGTVVGAAKAAIEIQRLQRELEETDLGLELEKQTLRKESENLDRLEHERNNERQYAEELSRRFKACQEHER